MTVKYRLRLLAVLAACIAAPLALANCSASSGSGSDAFVSTKKDGGTRDSSVSGGDDSGQSGGGDDATAGDDGASGSGDDAAPGPTTGVDGGACPANTKYPQLNNHFLDEGVAMGTPLTKGQSDAVPGDAGVTTPAGWDFHSGGLCRDGSPAGFFVHYSPNNSDKLYIYLEGGGACDSATFCSHNPANIQTVFAGGAATQGQTIIGSLTFATTGQVPYVASGGYSPGMFDTTNPDNPFKDWNGVYVPYCTGDVHFGQADDVDIPGDGVLPDEPHQHFVGRKNLESYIARIVPTFPKVSQVILTGASAGGFGAGLNYGMVQDSFTTKVPVSVIDDSGPPFSAQYLPPCLQKQWRTLWNFDKSLPKDCKECFNDDGSGLTDVVYYYLHKYPKAKIGLVTTMQDEVIRLFFSQELMSCASNNATSLTLGQALCGGYTCDMYTAGIKDLLDTFQCTGRVAGYQIGGMNSAYMNPSFHQHIFRDEFYKAITNDGSMTMAKWASDFISGKLDIVGP